LLRSRVTEKAKTELAARKTARNSLLGFVQYTKPDYITAPHHRLICEKLEAVERGEVKRLMIFTPPRFGKSELVSRKWPARYIGKFPRSQFISASYGDDLATDFGRDVRNLIASEEYRRLYPGTSLASDSAAKGKWHTTAGGIYISTSVGKGITGRGSDVLNIDDPVKDRIEAESETVRKNIWDWFASTAYTRLMPGAAIVLTMTRWHEADLAGKLLDASRDGGEQWEVVNLPAFANAQDDPLGRKVDEPLWPERYSAQRLTEIRGVIGEREFGALYQQEPRPLGTSFFDVQNCLIAGEPVEYPIRPDCVYAIIDTATKTGAKHDGTGCTFFAKTEGRGIPLVVLDWDIAKIEGALLEVWLPTVFERLEQLAVQTGARMGSLGAFIEDKNSGTVLLQHAARRGWPAQPIESKLTAAGKDERAISVMGHVSAGEVKLSRYAYDKVSSYNGRSGNHFLMQVFRFQIGVKDQQDDLLDTWTYGIAVGLGNAQGYA
jgi:hypothetical protein